MYNFPTLRRGMRHISSSVNIDDDDDRPRWPDAAPAVYSAHLPLKLGSRDLMLSTFGPIFVSDHVILRLYSHSVNLTPLAIAVREKPTVEICGGLGEWKL